MLRKHMGNEMSRQAVPVPGRNQGISSSATTKQTPGLKFTL